MSVDIYLSNMHASITGQRASRCEVIRPQQCGDDTVPVHLADHGAIHKVYEAILVHCNACKEGERTQM